MAEHIVHTFPGQAVAALTKGYFGHIDSAGKIAVSTLGLGGAGVISRSVSLGDASGLKYGIVEVVAGAAISAGDKISSMASGKAHKAAGGEVIRGEAITAASGDDVTFQALVYGPFGSTGNEPTAAVTADGAIAVPSVNKTFIITKAGVAAMTLVDPTATTHDGIRLTFISGTANAHTLDNGAGSGFNGGGAGTDKATFGAAVGDGITIVAHQGKWYVQNLSGTTALG